MPQRVERPKVVHVRAYDRLRFQRLEHVRSHWRSTPYQLQLPF
jgi:hypothetical protein